MLPTFLIDKAVIYKFPMILAVRDMVVFCTVSNRHFVYFGVKRVKTMRAGHNFAAFRE